MEITISIKNGTNPKDIAEALRKQATMFEGITGPKTKKAKPVEEDEEEVEDEDTDDADEEEVDETSDDADDEDSDGEEDADDAGESEDDEEDASDESDDDDEADEPPAKSTKSTKTKTKPTIKLSAKEEKMLKEVNKALKDKARKSSFEDVQKWLKKKFNVTSVNQLKPSEFATVIKAAKAK